MSFCVMGLIRRHRWPICCDQRTNIVESIFIEAAAMKASVLLGFAGIVALSLLEASVFIFAILSVLRVF
jgi:hypothetical protein